MKHPIVAACLVLAALASFAPAAPAAMKATTGFAVGVNGGLGGEASLALSDIATGFPFSVRLGAGFLSLDPGDAPLARQVFVNNATNGSPEKRGHRWDLRLDVRHPVGHGGLAGTLFYAGPRLSMYHGTFNFVDGNETFDVTTNQFGFGGGFERAFPMGPHTDLSIGAGVDWYANGDFVGHGSVYSPSGSNVDPKENFGYADANIAIQQPRIAPRFMVGLQHHIGW